jgi:hypothetical protein
MGAPFVGGVSLTAATVLREITAYIRLEATTAQWAAAEAFIERV